MQQNRLKSSNIRPTAASQDSSSGQQKYKYDEVFALVENAPSNILFCDLDFNIQYVNPKSAETLKTLEEHLPIKVEEIQGANIDVFHKNPAHQRKILANDSNLPLRSTIELGPEKLDLLVSALYSNDGKYNGVMVTWEVVTAKIENEANLARIESMMENAPFNVMCADMDGTITYLNPKSIETLRSVESALPVRVDDIKNGSYDVFHKNPSHQRTLLGNEKNLPHQAIIQVGEEKLDLYVSPMRDAKGNYIGPMVTWDVVTKKLENENKMAQVNSMMEQAPVNIMMADLDFNITYANPKSLETLKQIESLLPVSADGVVGSSIDVFHKDPSYQRGILKDDRNLPKQAKIKIGDESLDLLVSPVYDSNKEYVGAMVTWDIISDKIALVSTLEETSGQLSAAAEELSATATEMNKNSLTTSEQSTSAAGAAEEVSQGVQTVATNTEEMSSAIREIAKSSAEASEISKDALSKAQATNTTITQLGEASQEIGNVIKVISSIAQQTNLLALNATIEAARAGEAGKGFAVVANEVKELAKQTAKATEDITNRINNIQSSSGDAVTAIDGIGKVIENVNNIAMSIAASVEEQTAATNEVARVTQESNKGVEGIADTIKVVAEAAAQSAAGSSQTLEAAKGLSGLAEKLKELVGRVQV